MTELTFSVVVPAYNAGRTIRNCLDSLLHQTVDRERYEIIVVDDGSTDDTPQIVASYPGVRLVRQPNQGPAVARNRGVEEAKGEIVLFTDADCIPEQNWIEEMVRPFGEDDSVVGVKGVYRTRQREIIARFVQMEYEDKYDVMKRYRFIDFVDTYSAAFKRDVFLKFGGYDAAFPVACAEDVDLSFRLSKAGYRMVFNPKAVVYHIHPSGLGQFLKKKYKFAYWRMLAVKKNPDKILRDSHTPQTMKIQLLLAPFVIFSILAGGLYGSGSLPLIASLLFALTTVPFARKAFSKDPVVGLISPFLLFSRGVAQFCGVFMGMIKTRRPDIDG